MMNKMSDFGPENSDGILKTRIINSVLATWPFHAAIENRFILYFSLLIDVILRSNCCIFSLFYKGRPDLNNLKSLHDSDSYELIKSY